jgi:hypothetical protein
VSQLGEDRPSSICASEPIVTPARIASASRVTPPSSRSRRTVAESAGSGLACGIAQSPARLNSSLALMRRPAASVTIVSSVTLKLAALDCAVVGALEAGVPGECFPAVAALLTGAAHGAAEGLLCKRALDSHG